MDMESIFIAEADSKKQKINERDLLWHDSHFR